MDNVPAFQDPSRIYRECDNQLYAYQTPRSTHGSRYTARGVLLAIPAQQRIDNVQSLCPRHNVMVKDTLQLIDLAVDLQLFCPVGRFKHG